MGVIPLCAIVGGFTPRTGTPTICLIACCVDHEKADSADHSAQPEPAGATATATEVIGMEPYRMCSGGCRRQ